MAESVSSYAFLRAEIEKAREDLKDVDENIKKLIGRDPTEIRTAQRRPLPTQGELRSRPSERPFLIRRTIGGEAGNGPVVKRRNFGGAFSRLGPSPVVRRQQPDSADEDDNPAKHTVQSSVIAAPKEIKNRKEIMDQQKADSKGMARNKRMFGLLLGTLQKFKDEEQRKQDQVGKRQEIEKKLEAAAEKEKEDVKKARQELFVERRKRQADIRRLEQKVDLVKQFEEWEASEKHLVNFIQTKSIPHICYLPAIMNSKTQQRLKECRRSVEVRLLQRKAKLLEELNEIDRIREDFSTIQDTSLEVDKENLPIEEEEEEEYQATTQHPPTDRPHPIDLEQPANTETSADLPSPKTNEVEVENIVIASEEQKVPQEEEMRLEEPMETEDTKTSEAVSASEIVSSEPVNGDSEVQNAPMEIQLHPQLEENFEPIYD